jgi:GNAT superfamily N-acetyltransferase
MSSDPKGSKAEVAIEVSGATTPEIVDAIGEPLREFNEANNAEFWAARERPKNAPRALTVVARDSAGQVLGGLLAETQFKWLKVSIMSVHSGIRGIGIGRQILDAAEREAVARDCQYAYVDTMSYQSPGFYEALGYVIAGRLPDWDSHGHEKLFLTKRLPEK